MRSARSKPSRKDSLEAVPATEPFEDEADTDLLDTNSKPRRKRGGAVSFSEGGMAKARHDRPTRKSGGWIAGAVKHPGAFTAQAEKAGKSVPAMAQAHKNDSGTLGKRARLALTFEKMAKK